MRVNLPSHKCYKQTSDYSVYFYSVLFGYVALANTVPSNLCRKDRDPYAVNLARYEICHKLISPEGFLPAGAVRYQAVSPG